MTEQWAPVLDFEGYYSICRDGSVLSEERIVEIHGKREGQTARIKPKILAQHKDPQGYLRVTLARDGKLYSKLIHILLLESFVSPRPEGKWGLHWDDNELNNDLSNLRWGTPTENSHDLLRNGHNFNAKKAKCSKGHEFSEENTLLHRSGKKRTCRTCHTENTRAYRRKRAA